MAADKPPLTGSRTSSWRQPPPCETGVPGEQTRVHRPHDYKLRWMVMDQQFNPSRASISPDFTRPFSASLLNAAGPHGHNPLPGAHLRRFLACAAGLWGAYAPQVRAIMDHLGCCDIWGVYICCCMVWGTSFPFVLKAEATVSWPKSQYIPWEWKKPRTMRGGCHHHKTSILG